MTSDFKVLIKMYSVDCIDDYYKPTQTVPPILKNKYIEDLSKIFKSIMDRCSKMERAEDGWRYVIRYGDKLGKYEGFFLGKTIKIVQVEAEDATSFTINQSNVIKIKSIVSGVKTVMEFTPVTYRLGQLLEPIFNS